MRSQVRKKSFGFSLLELMVVVAITMVVSTMSLLVLKGSRDAVTLISARREAMGILEIARAEATKRDVNTQVTFIDSGTYLYQFSITGTMGTATHSLPAGVQFQFPAGVQNLVVTYTPSGKATMKGNDGTLYSQFSFSNSAGVKTLTISRAGDLSGSN